MYPQPENGVQSNPTVPLSVDCATAGLAIIMTVPMRMILGRLNKKLNRREAVESAINAVSGETQERGFGSWCEYPPNWITRFCTQSSSVRAQCLPYV